MKYTFRKGKHKPSFSFPLPHLGKTKQTYRVRFSASAWYKDADWERDWSKLVGWSYGFLPRKLNGVWEPAHHYNSARLVFRPALQEGWMEIATYHYVQGIRLINPVYRIPVEQDKELTLYSHPSHPTQQPGYTLSPFHGGTNPAQTNYTITLS